MALIYHYCDVNAFMSIIQNDLLWLSSLYSMNDTAEVEYVREAAVPAIENIIIQHSTDPSVLSTFRANLNSLNYYAACFSTESDDLYQWQAYGQRGKGFAIGFDSDLLCPYKPIPVVSFGNEVGSVCAPIKTAAIGQSLGVSEVKYLSATQIIECVGLMSQYMEYAFQASKDGGVSEVFDAIQMISVMSAVVKNSKFRAENEQRLLYAADISFLEGKGVGIIGDLKERRWRNGAHGITPYFEYKNVKRAIRRVVMGPNCIEQEGAHINDFLRSNGLSGDLLYKSEATLR